jgi:hypothetical protein
MKQQIVARIFPSVPRRRPPEKQPAKYRQSRTDQRGFGENFFDDSLVLHNGVPQPGQTKNLPLIR